MGVGLEEPTRLIDQTAPKQVGSPAPARVAGAAAPWFLARDSGAIPSFPGNARRRADPTREHL
jgi:hypothetical protein